MRMQGHVKNLQWFWDSRNYQKVSRLRLYKMRVLKYYVELYYPKQNQSLNHIKISDLKIVTSSHSRISTDNVTAHHYISEG